MTDWGQYAILDIETDRLYGCFVDLGTANVVLKALKERYKVTTRFSIIAYEYIPEGRRSGGRGMNFIPYAGFGNDSAYQFVHAADDVNLIRFETDDAIISIRMRDEDLRRFARMIKEFVDGNMEAKL